MRSPHLFARRAVAAASVVTLTVPLLTIVGCAKKDADETATLIGGATSTVAPTAPAAKRRPNIPAN